MRVWLKAHWIAVAVGAVLFFVGIGVGAAPSGAEEADADAAEPRTVTVNETESETVTETVTETVDPTEDQVAALDDREAELDDRAAALRDRERKVRERERKVRRAERVQARSRFGDGVYLVGKDIPAGSYIAPGGELCYWARLENGSQEILDNHLGAGQVRATINSGELFETNGCGTWRRG